MNLTKIAFAVSMLGVGFEASAADNLEINNVTNESNVGKATSCLIMSDTIDEYADVSHFISLTKDSDHSNVVNGFTINDRAICLTGLDFGTDYTAKINVGLKSKNGLRVNENIKQSFRTVDAQESINFLPGNVISANSDQKGVMVESVNINNFRATLFKISTRDLASYEGKTTSTFEYNWDTKDYLRNHGSLISSQVYQLAPKPNQKTFTIVDLKKLANSKLDSGIYALIITKYDKNYCQNEESCMEDLFDYNSDFMFTKSIIISDLGVTSYKTNNSIAVAVRSLTNSKPLKNVKASLISASNEVLETVVTDENGYAIFSKNAVQGKYSQEPILIQTTRNNDFFSLDLRESSLFIDGIKNTIPAPLNSNFSVYAYTNRTLVRPGEKIYYEAIVRKNDLKAADLKALKLKIYRPDGVLYLEKTLNNPVSGAFDYEFELPMAANLGLWNIKLGLDNRNIISSIDFNVDNFKPSTIMAKFANNDDIINLKNPVNVKVKYTYDAPAQSIPVNGYYEVAPDNHPFDKYKDYYFGANDSNIDKLKKLTYFPALTSDSSGIVKLPFEDIDSQNYPQKVNISLDLLDPNSKFLSLNHNYKLPFEKKAVGVKVGGLDPIKNTSEFNVILTDHKGKLYDGEVSYKISKHNISYQFGFKNGRWNYLTNEYFTPVVAGTISATEKNATKFDYPLDNGCYVIELRYGDVLTSANFNVGWTDSDTTHPERFDLYADKPSYNANDNVKLEFVSYYDGFADLLLGDDTKPIMKHFEIKKGQNKLSLQLPKNFVKGSYALLSTYADVNSKYFGSKRAIGVVYLGVNHDDNLLKISAEVPQKIKPNSDLTIKVKVANADDNTYITTNLVDNGILSINGQKAASPDKYFYGKPEFTTKIHDVYAYLLQGLDRKGQGYGDESMANAMAPQSLSNILDKLLSFYTPKIKVVNGEAEVTYKLKDLNTTATLMISGWSKDKVGSYSQNVVVKDIAVSKLNTPYYMHSGDTLSPTFSITNTLNKEQSYKYKISCDKPLVCNQEGDLAVAANSENGITIPLTSKNEGSGVIHIDVKGDNYSYETTQNIEVLSPMLKIAENKLIVLEPNVKQKVDFKHNYIDGTKVTVSYGESPFKPTKESLNDLLEQADCCDFYDSASIGLAALNARQLSEFTAQEKQNIDLAIAKSVAKVQSMIGPNGNLSTYFNDYRENSYAIAYAALFLFDADKAGFNVNKSILGILEQNLMQIQNSSNNNNAALALYVLAKNGVNVKATLTYKVDNLGNAEDENKGIESYANYANALGLYGDTERQEYVLSLGKEILADVYNKYDEFLNNDAPIAEKISYLNGIIKYMPFTTNSLSHDTLAIVESSLNASSTDDIDNLLLHLNDTNYIMPAGQYLLYKMAVAANNNDKHTNVVNLENNSLNITYTGDNQIFANVGAYGYTNSVIGTTNGISYTQEYYTKDGVKIVGPINLKLNEEVVVLNEINFEYPYTGNIVIQQKIPSNLVYFRTINSSNSQQMYSWINNKNLMYPDIIQGDTSLNVTDHIYDKKHLTIAYALKGAHVGTSVPLMNGALIKSDSYIMLNSYDKAQSITVK